MASPFAKHFERGLTGKSTPAGTRSRVLEAIAEASDSPGALLWVPADPESLRPGPWIANRDFPGDLAAAMDHYRRLERPWAPLRESPMARPPAEAFRRFLSIEEIFGSRRIFLGTPMYEQVWLAVGLDDQLRLLVRDEGRLIGLLATLRERRSALYSRRDRSRLSAYVGTIATLLVDAHRQALAALPEVRGELLVDMHGRVCFASESGRLWLDGTAMAQWLPAAIARCERDDAPAGVCEVGETRARWVRLEGDARRYLLYLSRLPDVPVHVMPHLSRRQRQVAERLADGATIVEIARDLDIAASSVRTHARALYRRLGVNDRLSLAERWCNGQR